MKRPLFLLKIYYKSPKIVKQHYISRIVYKPKLGKGVKLFGCFFFSSNVKIGSYTFMHENKFLSNVTMGKYCCILLRDWWLD